MRNLNGGRISILLGMLNLRTDHTNICWMSTDPDGILPPGYWQGVANQARFTIRIINLLLEQQNTDDIMHAEIGIWIPIDEVHPLHRAKAYLVSNGVKQEVAWISKQFGLWSSSFQPTHYFEWPILKEVTKEQIQAAKDRQGLFPGL